MNHISDSLQAKAERSIWAAMKRLDAEMSQEDAAALLHKCTGIALLAALGSRQASEVAYGVADELATLMAPE